MTKKEARRESKSKLFIAGGSRELQNNLKTDANLAVLLTDR